MISIILAVYNSPMDRIIFSLNTFLKQNYNDYEIIIADDGSKIDVSDKLKSYFKEKCFDKYKILRSEKNKGTVKNILEAACACKGDYIKTFGAGDGFYSVNSLGIMVKFIEKTNCDCGFANMQMYSLLQDKKAKIAPFSFPFGVIDFEKKKNLERNLVYLKDNASGASMWYKKDILIKYLDNAKCSIKYMEDICQLEILLDGHSIEFCRDCLFWYEGNVGISTNPCSPFSKKLYEDEINYYKYLGNKFPGNKWIVKRNKHKRIFEMKNARLRCMILTLFCPGQISVLLQRYLGLYIFHKYGSKTIDNTFIKTGE